MDRDQIIDADRTTKEYSKEVDKFIKLAESDAKLRNTSYIYCPCADCKNLALHDDTELIKYHLHRRGFYPAYKQWSMHGESEKLSDTGDDREAHNDKNMDDRLDEMVHDVVENFADKPEVLASLLGDSEKPLYPGCTKYTRLSMVLKLYKLKAANGWTDISFTALLKLLKDVLPEGNELPDRNYEAKKVLCPMGMEYEKIHACPNDCILYRNEYEFKTYCHKCKAPRYKKKLTSVDTDDPNDVQEKGAPAKVLWYLPIIPRFKRLFANEEDAKNLTWHADRDIPVNDKMLRHPADAEQWKKIDSTYPEFGIEPRNLRLGLCTDGMNPYGTLSSKHSCWPVMLVIYNLPPSLCMKRKYIMLSLMISGPKQPGNDIDVYLAPLVDDLKKLWHDGELVFDAHRQQHFTMRAMLFCTINDFPAYGNLSGYSVKGFKACPICEENTCSCQLVHGKKTVYTDHRIFLDDSHPYRRLKKAFNGKQEFREAPPIKSGEEVYERVKDIKVEYGKPNAAVAKQSWKRMSIFFKELPYWKTLDVRHCLDVMHIEKNICESLIGTLLNIPGKTKDGIKARLDMVDMGIRPQLAPEKRGERSFLPPACHTLSRKEKITFCEILSTLKVPQGYSSNISSLVSMKDLKLLGLKSHDCHVLMQQLLPVVLRSILPKHVRHTITRLCFFFNAICSKVVDPNKLDKLQTEIVVTLCQLEMYFPPSFFDIMVHLSIHLVREIKLCGPVYLRWMYPFERYMKIFKGYVKNRYRPEASIVEGYIAEEVIEFCTNYLSDSQPIGLPKGRHEGRIGGKGTRGGKWIYPNNDDMKKVHLYILQNFEEVHPYVESHIAHIKEKHRGWSDTEVLKEHQKTFITWFNNHVNGKDVSETIRWLAYMPNPNVKSYSGYDINGYSFYTKSQDDKSSVQNSGVTLEAETWHVSSSKDKNVVYANMSYYGVIEDIWEIDYLKFKVPVFRCKWVDSNGGVRFDDQGFTLVDLNREGFKSEPFIMASQAKQVFYITDPCDKKWSVVLQGKKQVSVEDEIENDVQETPSFSKGLPQVQAIVEEKNMAAFISRIDHEEGLWVEDPLTKKRKKKSK